MNFLYLIKLCFRYVKFYKKQFIPLLFVIFLSTFLLSSLFIAKDSYDAYEKEILEYTYGSWDMRCALKELALYGETNDQITENMNVRLYAKNMSLKYEDNAESFQAVSKFDDTLPISLEKGSFPTNDKEILVEATFAKSKNFHVGSTISMKDEEGNITDYSISGTYENHYYNASTSFYTFLNSDDYREAEYAYIDIADEYTTSFISVLDDTIYTLNTEVFNSRHHMNQTFDKVYELFICFVFVCVLIFVGNSTMMYVRKKQEYLYQLFMLGATKGQIRIILLTEFLLFCSLTFVFSFIMSLAIWNLLLNIGAPFIMELLDVSFEISFALTQQHIVHLIIMNILLFILSIFISLWRARKLKKIKLHGRYLFLHKHPLHWWLAIKDTIRTGYGAFIVIMIIAVTSFFQITQLVVESWVTTATSRITYDADVNVNFDFFEKSSKEINQIIKQIEKLCARDQTTYIMKYNIQATATIGNKDIDDVYSISQAEYTSFLKQHNVKDTSTPILIDMNDEQSISGDLHIQILSKWREQIDDVAVKDYISMKDGTFETVYLSDSGYVLLIPNKLTNEWINTYSESYVSGSLAINGLYSTDVAKTLERMAIGNEDHMYVLNNIETIEQINHSVKAVRIFIYSFNAISIVVSMFIIFNLLSQSYANRKRDIYLLHAVGMTKGNIKKHFVYQSLFLSIIALILSSIVVEGVIICIINKVINFDISMWTLAEQYVVYSVLFMALMTFLTLLGIKNHLKIKQE